MKILYITTRIDGMGGLQRVVSDRLNYWTQHTDLEITLITSNSKQENIYFPLHSSIKTIDISPSEKPLFSFFKYKKQLQNIFKKGDFDLVLVSDNGLKSVFIPYLLNKKTKIIYERHVSKTATIQSASSLLRWFKVPQLLLHFLTKRYSCIVTLTDSEHSYWNHPNLVTIPNPISFQPLLQSNYNSKKVIFVGRHSYQKGLDYLIFIWKKIHREFPDWHLDIYGSFSNEISVSEWIEQNSLYSSVTLHQPVSNIFEKYSEASILLMTSRFEGFGLVLVEAMACGVPCVAFDCPTGPSEIIQNGENGFLIPCFEEEEFVKQAKKLLTDEHLRKAMAKKAFQSVEKFQREKIMQQWEELLQKTMFS
jgi:glycosyltransferase involved in cell wall biosynthesis